MGTVLVFVTMILTGLIGYFIGRQRYLTELIERNEELDTVRRQLVRREEYVNYLQADNDRWQRRTRHLENDLVARAHLEAIPPRATKASDIDPSLITKPPIEQEALGLAIVPKEIADWRKG